MLVDARAGRRLTFENSDDSLVVNSNQNGFLHSKQYLPPVGELYPPPAANSNRNGFLPRMGHFYTTIPPSIPHDAPQYIRGSTSRSVSHEQHIPHPSYESYWPNLYYQSQQGPSPIQNKRKKNQEQRNENERNMTKNEEQTIQGYLNFEAITARPGNANSEEGETEEAREKKLFYSKMLWEPISEGVTNSDELWKRDSNKNDDLILGRSIIHEILLPIDLSSGTSNFLD